MCKLLKNFYMLSTAYPINQTTQTSTYESLMYIQGEKRLPTEPPLLRVQTLAVESLSWFCLFRTNDVFPHEFKWPYRLSRDNCCFAKNAAIYIISRDPETLVTLRIVMNASLKFYSLISKTFTGSENNFSTNQKFPYYTVNRFARYASKTSILLISDFQKFFGLKLI